MVEYDNRMDEFLTVLQYLGIIYEWEYGVIDLTVFYKIYPIGIKL